MTKISTIFSIFSPILCVLAQFYAIFQDFFITFRIFPEKLITPLKCYFSNVNLFIFSFFETNFIEKFLWESGFSKFGQNRNNAK